MLNGDIKKACLCLALVSFTDLVTPSHFAEHVQLKTVGDVWALAELQGRYVHT